MINLKLKIQIATNLERLEEFFLSRTRQSKQTPQVDKTIVGKLPNSPTKLETVVTFHLQKKGVENRKEKQTLKQEALLR